MHRYRLHATGKDIDLWNRAAKRTKAETVADWMREALAQAAIDVLYIPRPDPPAPDEPKQDKS